MRLSSVEKRFFAIALACLVQLGLALPANATAKHAVPRKHSTPTHHRAHVRKPAAQVGHVRLTALRQTSDDPGLHSASALIIDQSDAQVLYSRRADIAAPIASISKLLTALVVADAKLPMDEVLEVTDADRAIGKGAYSRLTVGAQLTRGDLLHLALMASENRAAHALGRNYPGGLPAFVQAMNAKARALGMISAHFVEPTGLSSENVASAEDLSRLVAAASRNPVIREYSTDPDHSVRIGRRLVEFHNTDALVRNPDWDITVQKTGFINEAGHCLVMQVVVGGRDMVIVLLNSFGKYTRVADAIRVRRWVEARMSTSTHSAHVVAAN